MKIFALFLLTTMSLYSMECRVRLITSVQIHDENNLKIQAIPIRVYSKDVKLYNIQQRCLVQKVIKSNDIPLHLLYQQQDKIIMVETISQDSFMFDIDKKYNNFYLIPISQINNLLKLKPSNIKVKMK